MPYKCAEMFHSVWNNKDIYCFVKMLNKRAKSASEKISSPGHAAWKATNYQQDIILNGIWKRRNYIDWIPNEIKSWGGRQL